MFVKVSKIRAERLRRKLSVTAVAAAISINVGTLSRIETGRQQPTQEIARNLYRFYRGRVTLGDIYDPMFAPAEMLPDELARLNFAACGKSRQGRRDAQPAAAS